MSLCTALESALLRSQADSEKLMEAVVSRVLELKSQNEKIK
ncbi:MAG: hypothetical protein Q7U60_07075 [Candidatus Methanoperedens sp.]|nr:hypothetical protein [Candidatus Methanoperedens sp.]